MATYESKKYATIPIAATQIADGSVSNSEFQTVDTSTSINTQLGTKASLAGATFTGGVRINDSQNLNIGSGTDLVISHDTNNSKINNTTGELRIAGDSIKLMNQAEDETHLTATADGAVGLRHNNVEKLATSATGITVSGTLAATAVTGDGSGLSNLPAGPPGPSGPTGPTGPGGAAGITHMSSNFDNTTRDLVTVGPGGWPGSGTAPASATGATQTGAALTIDVTNLSKVQLTFGMKYWQSTAKTDQQYVTGFSTAQMRLLRGSTGLTDYSPGADEAYMIDEYSQYWTQNYKRRPRDITQAIVDDVSSLTGNQTYYVEMRAIWGAGVSGYYSGGNYSTTASYTGMTTGFLDVRSYGCFISAVGA